MIVCWQFTFKGLSILPTRFQYSLEKRREVLGHLALKISIFKSLALAVLLMPVLRV